jgi:hypothetical protein
MVGRGRFITFAAAWVLGAAAVGAPGSAAASPTTESTIAGSTTEDPVSAQAVVQKFFSFTDSSRGASCDGITSSSRTTQGLVFYDDTLTGPLPTLVLAPGFGGPNPQFFTQAPYYASRGYFVILPFFPVSSGLVEPFNFHTFPTPQDVPLVCGDDIPNQPGDISFVLTELANNPNGFPPSGVAGGLPAGLFDATHTGIWGISGGAITAMYFFNDCCADPRIVAVLSEKGFPAPLGFFNGGPSTPYDFSRHIALFMLNGCSDTQVDENAGISSIQVAFDAWSDAGAPKYFLEDPNPAFVHNDPWVFPPAAAGAQDAFFDRYIEGITTPATLSALLADAGSPDYRYLTEVEGEPSDTSDPACLAQSPVPVAVPVAVQPSFTG